MKTIEDEADYYIQDADARMRSCKPEDLPTFTEQLKGAFIAGANKVRGRLTAHYEAEIAKYKRDLDESREREKIACKAVAEKREEIARLTKWNDPKVPPVRGKNVLVKYTVGTDPEEYFTMGSYLGCIWEVDAQIVTHIIGWREIHE